MTEFERETSETLSNIRERLSGIETTLKALPCKTNCEVGKSKGNDLKKWLALGFGIGAGLIGSGTAVAKILGI